MENLKQDMLYWAKRLYQKGFNPGVNGNISVRCGDNILISRSGVCLNDMKEDDLVLIDSEGNILEENKKASSEKFLHVLIYEKREDIKAIVHSHCPYITAFAVSGMEISKPILPEFVLNFEKVPLASYKTPSSLELAQETAKYFDKYSCVLMANHGVIIGGDTLQNCFYNLEMLKNYVETYFASEVLGGVKLLSKKQVDDIKKLRK